METVRYKIENGQILEFRKDGWHCRNEKIPDTAFYQVGKNENLDKYKNGTITAEEFLSRGDDPEESFCAGYLYIIIEGKMKRTEKLEKVIED